MLIGRVHRKLTITGFKINNEVLREPRKNLDPLLESDVLDRVINKGVVN